MRLLLDDFGIGYTALGYLHRLPIDGVKIDRAGVADIGEGARQSLVLDGIIRVARHAGLKVIAEGVAERSQLEQLRSRGCDAAQGFLFAPPLAPGEIPRFLRRSGTIWSSAGARDASGGTALPSIDPSRRFTTGKPARRLLPTSQATRTRPVPWPTSPPARIRTIRTGSSATSASARSSCSRSRRAGSS